MLFHGYVPHQGQKLKSGHAFILVLKDMDMSVSQVTSDRQWIIFLLLGGPLTFIYLLCGKVYLPSTKGTKNKVFPNFEKHSLVLYKVYWQLCLYNMVSAEIITYKALQEHRGRE